MSQVLPFLARGVAAGFCPTMALQHYADDENHFPSWLCTMSPTTATTGAMLQALCDRIDDQPDGRRSHIIFAAILRHLTLQPRGDCALLLIDEAQFLTDQALETLRCLHDAVRPVHRFGLVLCGNADFRSRLNTAKSARFAQLTSRIGPRLDIDGSTPEDVAVICQEYGVTDPKARGFLVRYAAAAGGLRVVHKLFQYARDADGRVRAIDLDHLRHAAKTLGFSP